MLVVRNIFVTFPILTNYREMNANHQYRILLLIIVLLMSLAGHTATMDEKSVAGTHRPMVNPTPPTPAVRQQVVRQQVAARPRATTPVTLIPTGARTRMSSLN